MNYPSQRAEPLFLLSSFVTQTSTTLAWLGHTRWIWASEVPRESESKAFLRHALLATSALHICSDCSLQPSSKSEYQSAALHHYTEATELFRSSVTQIDHDNCIAVFGFSLLISVFQLGVISARTVEASKDAWLHPVNAISALRGAGSLLHQIHPHLAQTRLSGIFPRLRIFGNQPLSRQHQEDLDGLDSLNTSSNALPEARAACSEAINLLRRWLIVTSGSPSTWVDLAFWPSLLPDGYMSLLKQSDPFSLLISCYWSMTISRKFEKWYLARWPQQTLQLVMKSFEPEWHYALRWADLAGP